MLRISAAYLILVVASAVAAEPPAVGGKQADGPQPGSSGEGNLATNADVRRMLGELKRDLVAELPAKLEMRFAEVERRLADIENRLAQLEHRDGGVRVSEKPRETKPGMASVHLVNQYAFPMSATVNGILHTVEAGASKSIDVAIGVVNVQVMQVDAAPRVRTLNAGQTMIVTIR